ncbi:MAG: MalM family protein [Casimicrobium sp.]
MKPLHIKTITLICGVLLLAGCQTPSATIAERTALRESTAQIVDSFRALTPTAIALPSETEAHEQRVDMLNSATPEKVRQAGAEPVFARLFTLPQHNVSYAVKITTSVLGGRENPAVYYPRMIFLDESFNVTRHTTQRDFRFRGSGVAGVISATVFVNPQNRNERYLVVVEEPPKDVAEQLSLIAGQAPPPMVLPLPLKLAEMMWVVASTSNEPERKLRAMRAGVYDLTFTPYKARKLGE